MGNRLSFFLLGATLALGFTMASWLLANALRSIKDDSGIRVKGFAEVAVKSDLAVWRLAVMVRSKELKDGYEILERDLNAVKARLGEYGFAAGEFAAFAATVEEETKVNEKGIKSNEVEGYKLTQAISVSSPKVALVDGSAKRITELMAGGVRVISYQPEFTFGGLEGLKIDLIGKASGNAHERARAIAEKAGSRVGRIRSASQGVFQIVPLGSTETSDYGSYDTTTIDKVVKAVVTIDFMIDR